MSVKKVSSLLFIISLLGLGKAYSASLSDSLNFTSGNNNDSIQANFIATEYTYEYVPDVTFDLVQDRLSCLDFEIHLELNPKVKSFIDYFAIRDREYTKLMIRRMNVYFPIFEKYLKKYNLPEELKYLSIVESGLNPRAVSRVGATGLWQFMPATGRYFKLHQDWYIDERMDPEKATEAACLYLKQLYNMFDDWEMALASYNAGPGNVRKAIRRSGYKKTFWEVYDYLPRETRSYVPQFVAIAYVMNYAQEHNFFVEDQLEYTMASDTLLVSQYLDLKTLANQMNVCVEDLENLNPEVKRGALPENVTNYPLRIPLDKNDFINENRVALLDSASKTGKEQLEYLARNTVGSTYGREKVVYKIRSGDVLGKIAGRYNVRISDLRKWNNINGNLIRAGQHLAVWVKSGHSTSINNSLANSSNIPMPVTDSKMYLVQPGDTLWDISKKYEGLTIAKIKELNNLTGNKIKPGQKLVIN